MPDEVLACPVCNRDLYVDQYWAGINACRGLALLPWVETHPNMTAWELSKLSGMAYSQVSKGMAKLRDMEAVNYESEDREVGGIRYRYSPSEDHKERKSRFQLYHDRAVGTMARHV